MRTTVMAALLTVALVGVIPGVFAPLCAQEPPAAGERVAEGLAALYRGDNVTEGGVMVDLAETLERLDLTISPAPPQMVTADNDAVTFGSAAALLVPGVFSTRPATALIQTLKETGQLTVEAWLFAANSEQGGPARIVSISRDASSRNMTLGQEGSEFILRLRTSETNEQGTPALHTPEGTVHPGELQHIVVTFDGHKAAFYVDGQAVSETTHFAGDLGIGMLQNWDESMHLMLGNEFNGDRFWSGTIHLVALYSDALTAEQVQANFAAGL